MKNKFLPWLLLPVLIIYSSSFFAQPSKLTGAFNASFGIVADSKGNFFLTGNNRKIIIISPEGKAVLFAGGGRNGRDGKGKDAGFNDPEGIAIDAADNLYLADGSRIRKISPDAVVTTYAGSNTAAVNDGNRQTATFCNLENIAIDSKGTIYVTDYAKTGSNTGDYCIRKISTDGRVTTIKEGDSLLVIKYPRGLACDAAGNLYVNASVSHCIKKISPTGVISTVAGQCDKTIFNSVYKEGDIKTAVLTCPSGLAIAKNGDLYITDTRLNRIIKIANGKVSTVAGSGKLKFSGNPAGAAEPGYTDGKALSARFNAPNGIAIDKKGNLIIIDASNSNNSYLRKLSLDGMVTTFCKHVWNPKTIQYEEAD